jgi:hypothetical protein
MMMGEGGEENEQKETLGFVLFSFFAHLFTFMSRKKIINNMN